MTPPQETPAAAPPAGPQGILTPADLMHQTYPQLYYARLYMDTPQGPQPIQRIYEGRAAAGPNYAGQLLLSPAAAAPPQQDSAAWREIWPTPVARGVEPALAAIAQAQARLQETLRPGPNSAAAPRWNPETPQLLAAAIEQIYDAIRYGPERPSTEYPSQVSSSRPDGIPYALTKLFQLQKKLPERFGLEPESRQPLPPEQPANPQERELLAGAQADLQSVQDHWRSPNW